MKITKRELKQIIKEEITKTLHEVAEDDPSEWGQNISSYFDEIDAYRELSQVLHIPEEDLKTAIDNLGLNIVPAEDLETSPDDRHAAAHANRAPAYSDEPDPELDL